MRTVTRLAPFALYLGIAFLIGDWIVDDAGISYAYARNLAHGHGLVSQPGLPAVEGYSNFLWVLVLSPLMLVRLFDPVFVPKILSAIFVLIALLILQRSVARATGSEWPGLFAAFAIAVSPPIVIWTMSGLENGLTLLLATVLALQLIEQPRRWPITAGLMSALLAMNHPELILLFGTGFLICLATRSLPVIASFTLAFAIPVGAFFAFRLAVFGLPLPHTYYAKRTTMSTFDRLAELLQAPLGVWNRAVDLAQGLGGMAAVLVVVLMMVAAAVLLVRRRLNRATAVWLVLAVNATAAYLWMEDDWMGEFRFATVIVLATFTSAALAAHGLLQLFPAVRSAGAVAAAAAIVFMTANAVTRVNAFAANPTTPYGDVSRRTAAQFDAYARHVTTDKPSVLVADIGATIYESSMRVYDLAGLCEPDVIRTLKKYTQYWLTDHPEFYDWVFDEVKPTFISTDKFWTFVPAFEKDPRFRRDYIAINAYADDYIRRVYQVSMRSGDFVRRDALAKAGDVERMRQGYQPPAREDMQVDSNAAPEAVVAAARRLDEAGRPHDARWFWARALAAAPPGSPLFIETLERLGDGRAMGTQGDALDPEMAKGMALLYTAKEPASALPVFDDILQANPSHYGARFQRARSLTLLARRDDAHAAWTIVAAMAARIGDRNTAATARAELGATPH